MANPKTQRRALWMAPEDSKPGGSGAFATDPLTGYLAIPGTIGDIQDQLSVLETNRHTGRDGSTPSLPGSDAASFSLEIEALGFTTQVGNGVAPPADDWFDMLAAAALGDVVTRNGATVVSAGNIGSDLYDVGDIIPFVDATGTLRWAPVQADAEDGSYTIPDLGSGFTPTLAPGCKLFRWDGGKDLTDTFTAVRDDDAEADGGQQYTLPGTKVTGVSWAMRPNERAKGTLQLSADALTETSKTGLATNTGQVASTPLKTGCVYVDDVLIDQSEVTVDFGLTAAPRASTCRESGRSQHLLVSCEPIITVTPMFDKDLAALKRSQATRSVLVQLGHGPRSVAWYAPVCQVTEAQRQDDAGNLRLSVQFRVRDAGVLANGNARPRFVMGRC